MIVGYDEIRYLSKEELREIRSVCTQNHEMFAIVFNHTHLLRHFDNIDCGMVALGSPVLTCEIADMILFQDRDGKFKEIKNRHYSHGKLRLEPQVKVVVDE